MAISVKSIFVKLFLLFAFFGCTNSFIFPKLAAFSIKPYKGQEYTAMFSGEDKDGANDPCEEAPLQDCEKEESGREYFDNDLIHCSAKGILSLPALLYSTKYPEHSDGESALLALDHSLPPES